MLRAENTGSGRGEHRRRESLPAIRRLRRRSFCCVVERTRNASLRVGLMEFANPPYTREFRRFEYFYAYMTGKISGEYA
jgi:hypothetical protein